MCPTGLDLDALQVLIYPILFKTELKLLVGGSGKKAAINLLRGQAGRPCVLDLHTHCCWVTTENNILFFPLFGKINNCIEGQIALHGLFPSHYFSGSHENLLKSGNCLLLHLKSKGVQLSLTVDKQTNEYFCGCAENVLDKSVAPLAGLVQNFPGP